MRKKRIVYLLGAGAALDWKCAPTTNCLTERILKIGFKNQNGEYITQKIFDKLRNDLEPGFSKVNFETITNVLEDFVEFWSKEKVDQLNGLSFFVDENDFDWKNYLGKWKIQKKYSHSYSLIIEDASDRVISNLENIPKSIKPEKKFFEALIIEVLDFIVSEISRYSYHSEEISKIFRVENRKINVLTENFFKQYRNCIQRIYTLNYDSIMENIFNKSGFPFSDGFQEIPKEMPQNMRHFTPTGVYSDFENSNSIYHLHGSIFWETLNKDSNGLPYYNFISTTFPQIPFNTGTVEVELEKGKPMLIQNIITGYRKVLKTGLSPFRQYFSVFDMDLLKSDELIIIGYSFGDEHINDMINKARSSNQNLKIEIIDPSFDFKSFSMNHLRKWYWINDFLDHKKLDEKTTFYKQANLYVFKCGFKQYLEKKTSKQ